jgi:hypothetical protein
MLHWNNMEINNNGTRFNKYYLWEDKKYISYDYARDGLLKHIMSPVILETNNPTLKILLQFVESSLIFAMKYVDILKNFKNTHWKNR